MLEFLRDVGTHFSVNAMLGRETVKRRLAAEGMTKVPDESWTPSAADLLPGGWLVVRRGKRNLTGIRAARD